MGLSHWLLLACLVCPAFGVQSITNPRIVEHPEDQYVAKNQPATLNCKAEGVPPPDITWYRNGVPVVTAADNPASHRMLLPSGQLFFLSVIHNKNNKPDVGVYYCNATNPETRVSVISRNASLEIAVMRGDFRETPVDTEVAVGEDAVLDCTGPRSLPEPKIKWKKDSEFLRLEGRFRLQDGGNLLIQNTQKSDSGQYVCVAQNIAGERETNSASLNIRERPRFLVEPQDIQVREHDDVTFHCQANGDPSPTIIWKKHQGKIPKSRSSVLADKSLQLTGVEVSDEGRYICRAQNSVGFVEESATLTVYSEPSFTVTPQDKEVGVGRRVSFRCEVTGNPPPAVYWKNRENHRPLMFPSQDLGRFSVSEDGTLVIDPVEESDAGEYVCQANSVVGTAIARATLQVREVDPRPPPIIQQGHYNQTLPVNTVGRLHCSATGNPPPTIHWFRDGQPVTVRDPRVEILDSGTLQISSLRTADTGMYTCKARSETGETAWSAALVVEERRSDVVFHRTPEPSTFPGPPGTPTISNISETSVKLRWKSNPNHGASPIITYTVEYFSHETGEGWIVASDSVNLQSYVVHGLRPNTPYIFLVRAQNTHGLSLPSQVTQPVWTLGGRPGRPGVSPDHIPRILSGQVLVLREARPTRNGINIRWVVKKAHNFIEGVHINYRALTGDRSIDRRPDPSDYSVVTAFNTNTYALQHLQYRTQYEIRVQPFYNGYVGQMSNPLKATTLGGAPSRAPDHVTARMLDNSTVSISWAALPPEFHNGVLRGYKVVMMGNESRFHREIETDSQRTSVVVSDLTPGMRYRIEVRAFTDEGDGNKSTPIIIGPDSEFKPGIWSESWFIGTLIGVIGGTLWLALCVFSIWLYKKRKAKKKFHKNGVMNVPVHKSEDTSRDDCVTNGTPLLDVGNQGNNNQPQEGQHGDPVDSSVDEKEPVYNLPSVSQTPMRTFYNKHALAAQCGPYATTTLINAAQPPPPPPSYETAFRPIQPGFGVQGSHENCLKQEGTSSDSNNDSSRLNGDLPCHAYDVAHHPYDQVGMQTYDQVVMPPDMTPMSEYSLAGGDDDPMRHSLPMSGFKQPVLYLPPPPEHPPPSDIGTPPESPSQMRHYSPAGYPEHAKLYPQQVQQTQNSVRSTPAYDITNGNYSRNSPHYANNPPQPRISPANNQQAPDPKFHTMCSRTHTPQTNCPAPDSRSYSPRAMSEPDNRGPSPPVRGYKMVPTRDNDAQRHYSDTEGAPTPPSRMMMPPHSPPSPAPEDPTMDRGIQSSLPSLASEYINQERDDDDDDDETLGDSDELSEDDDDDDPHYNGVDEQPVTGSWVSEATEPSEAPSVRTSGASSSDGSFFAEADFASAVAKAAEMSGLTVVGSTVMDPSSGREGREKIKKSARQRQRAHRPTSPYSTDSNYSCVQVPHRPYPKSERKRQLQEHRSRHRNNPVNQQQARPKPNNHVPQHVADMPSYNKPNFPMSGSGWSKSGVSSPARSLDQGDVRTNPMAAFDTRDTPIV